MREILQKLTFALQAYGPWGVFLLSVIDSMGVPLPAAMDLLVLATAVAAAKGAPSQAWLAALMASLGSIAGNVFLFQTARHGRRMLSRGDAAPGKRRRFQEWFRQYGLVTVFVPAVTPIVPLPLKVFVISAGAFHTSFGKFMALIVVARLIRYFGLAWLGLQLGENAQAFITRYGWVLALIALGMAVAVYWLIRLNTRRRGPKPPAQS
jgi:membrane protein YqaA with SNARE-associated domain